MAVMEVTARSPLHPYYSFWQRLPLGNLRVTSLQMGYSYLYLRHHGRDEAAFNLLKSERFRWKPEEIQTGLLQREVPQPNVKVLVKAVEMVRCIVMHQVEQKSEFVKAFRNELEIIGNPSPGKVQFRVYTANHELIFSSGNQYQYWREPTRGFNAYAGILEEAHKAIVKNSAVDTALFHPLTTNFSYFHPVCTKSLFLASDSQGKFFASIVGGTVTAVSGGNFGHINEVLRRNPDWRDHKWVIIYCGTNCRAKSSYAETARMFEWKRLRETLKSEAQRRNNDGSLLFCNSFEHPHVDVNPGLADHIEMELHGTGVRCINFRTEGNPFLDQTGMPIPSLFDTYDKRTVYAIRSEIHLSHAGLNRLWKVWARHIEALRFLPMTMSAKPLSLPKYLFEPQRNEPADNPNGTDAERTRTMVGCSSSGAGEDTRDDRDDGRVRSVIRTVADNALRPSTSKKRRANASIECSGKTPKKSAEKDGQPNLRVELPVGREDSQCRIFYEEAN